MAQEKRLFEPREVEELLRGWLLHAHKGRDRHDEATRRYEVGRYALGVPTLILSTIVGTSVFSTLGGQKSTSIQLAVGFLSVAAGVLAALQTFMDFPTRAERHRNSAVKYKAVIRELEQVISQLGPGSVPTTEWLDRLRERFDGLEEDAPVVVPRIFERIERRYANVQFVQQSLDLYR